jgi:dTDP-4-dehydrorhamnose reductase
MYGNVIAAYLLLEQCLARDIHLTHVSSGCIYQGDNNGKGFSETDEPNFFGPQFYAKTKIISEKILAQFPCLQLRIRMPIDDRPSERNLIDKLVKYPRVIDVQNSMTTVPDFIPALRTLVERSKTGIYNVVNPGTISAQEIMQLYREFVDANHTFEVFSLDDLDKVTVGKRSNCRLSVEKLKLEGIVLPEIQEAVISCLKNYRRVR